MQYLKRKHLMEKTSSEFEAPYSLTDEGRAALAEMTRRLAAWLLRHEMLSDVAVGSTPDFLLGGRTSASAECRHWSGRAVRWSSGAILLSHCPVLLYRHADISERSVPGRHTEHDLKSRLWCYSPPGTLARAAVRGAVSISSGVVTGFAASTSVTTVVMVRTSRVRSASSTA